MMKKMQKMEAKKEERKRRRKEKKLQEVTWKDEESQRITSKGNRPEKKNPYLQIKAAKLDSATDISALRQTTSQSILKTAGTQPNEDSFKLQGSQRDSEEVEEDQFTGGQWLEEALFEELEELTKEVVKLSDMAPSFSGQALKNQLTTPVPVQLTQKTDRQEEVPTFDFEEAEPEDFPEDLPFEENDPNDIPLPPSLVDNEDDIRSAMGDNVGDEIFGAANIIQAAGAEPIEPQSFGDSHSVFSSGATSNGDNDISDAMSMISLGSDASKIFDAAFNTSTVFRRPRLPPRLRIISTEGQKEVRAPQKPKRQRIKRVDKKLQIIDFLADFDDMSLLERVSNRKKKIQDDSEKFLLPDNDVLEQDFDENMFCAKKFAMRDFPFLRLGQRVHRQNTENPDEEQSDHQNGDSHDAPEPNFASDDDFPVGDFAPPDDDDDDIPAHFPDETFNEDNATPMDTNGLPQPEVGLGELAQVKQVEKIKMKFDRRNRRVNVKTVKKEMWNVIKEAREKSFLEKENIENEAEEPEANFGTTTFTDMQEELQSKLEGENKENLTPAMALVCVLYLANEKGLELEQTSESNFLIKAPEKDVTAS